MLLLIAAAVLHKHTPKILTLLETGNVNDIENYIREEGQDGVITLILLQVLSTASIILPIIPIYICAGVVYGKIKGILICYITNLVSVLLIFLAASKMKNSSVSFIKIHSSPKIEEWFQRTKHPSRIILAMCLMPIVPNGTIPYFAAEAGVTLPDFLKALAIGSIPWIAIFVCGGDIAISSGKRLIFPLIIILIFAVIISLIFKKQLAEKMEKVLHRWVFK